MKHSGSAMLLHRIDEHQVDIDARRRRNTIMHGIGNVAEWCEDAWPGTPDARVIRGGSYLGFERDRLLTSAREHAAKANTRNDLGFRIVIDLGSN